MEIIPAFAITMEGFPPPDLVDKTSFPEERQCRQVVLWDPGGQTIEIQLVESEAQCQI